MATIREVAELAGVAPMTASRVINRSGSFSEVTRARVDAAAAALGYVPNRVASSLRSKRTNTIGVVVTDITNPFWTTVVRGAEDVTSAHGMNVIVCNTDESESKQRQYVDVLLAQQVDGFLMVPAGNSPVEVRRVQRQGVPLVVLDRKVPADVDVVRADSEAGAYQVTQYLTTLGHRRIAFLGGPAEVSIVADRVRGYRRALAEVSVPEDGSLVFHGGLTQSSGFVMCQAALSLTPRPTALFAMNNFLAIGAMRALNDAEVRVPEDMALVGFDDLPEELVVEPFLTAAVQPAYEMGKRATELLLTRLAQPAPEKPEEIVLPTSLVVRRSSGEPIR